MPINDWFKQRESRQYTVSAKGPGASLPDGVWRTCPECKKTLYQGDVAKSLSVCYPSGNPVCDRNRSRIVAEIILVMFNLFQGILFPVISFSIFVIKA